MKLLLLLLAVATFAGGQSIPGDIETIYTKGKEYIYQYESQIFTGLPVGSDIYSGLKVKAQIVLQKTSYVQMKMELRSPRVFKINGHVQPHDPTREMIPSNIMTELLDSDAEKMKSSLTKPVMFLYEDGHVDFLVTDSNDPVWSVNIKKGALSLLEVNFNNRHSLSPRVDVLSADSQPKLYKVMEASVSGECETTYKLKTDLSRDGVPSMDIVKVRDLSKCLDKAIVAKTIKDGTPCEKAEEIVSAQSSVRYTLLGAPGQHIIMSAVGESQYNLVPHMESLARMTALANQTLILVNSQPITTPILDPKTPKEQESLVTESNPEQKHKSSTSQGPSSEQPNQQELVNMVQKALTGIDELIKDKVEDEVIELLKDLHTMVEKLDETSIKSIISTLDNSPSKLPRARKALLDMLPLVDSHAAVDILLERIEKKEMPSLSAVVSVITLGLHPKPDIPIVKRVMDSVEKADKMEPIVKRSMWLCLGALGHKLVKENSTEVKALLSQRKILKLLLDESNDRLLRKKLNEKLDKIKDDLKQTEELYKAAKEEIIKMVENLYKSGGDESKLLAVKVMGSLMYRDFLETLQTVAMDRDSSVIHRLVAILNMNILLAKPEEIKKILLPMYFDRSDEEEVRSMAVLVSLQTDLPRPELELIAKSLADEPSAHVSSLVLSVLTRMSNAKSSEHCLKSLSYNSTMAMRLAQKHKLGLHRSNMVHKSTYNEEMQMGQAYEHVMMYSSKEKLPRAAAMRLTSLSKRSSINFLEIGYNSIGLDSVLDKILDGQSLGGVSDLVRKLLHPRHRRGVSETEQEIKDIKEKLEVKPRKSEPIEGYVFLRLYGQEVIYFDIKDLLPKFSPVPKGKHSSLLESLEGRVDSLLPDVSSILETIKKLMNTQKTLVLPIRLSSLQTETGLPLKLHSKSIAALKLEGDIQIQLDPKSSTKKSILSQFDSIVKMKLSGVVETNMDMMTELKSIQSGLSIKARASLHLPSSMSVNMNPKNNKLLVRLTDQKKFEPLKVEMKPVTFIKKIPENVANYPSIVGEREIPILEGAKLTTTSYDVGQSVLGRKVSVISMLAVRRDTGIVDPLISGKQVINVVYDPLSHKDLDIELQHVKEIPGKKNEDEGSKSKWWFLSWLSPDEDAPPEDPEEERPTANPVEDFIDLKEKDLTISYLIGKFGKDTEILKSGEKCGLVIRVADPGPSPKHALQLSTLYQRNMSAEKHLYAIELRKKSTSIQDEKDWKMVTVVRTDLPTSEVEPSDLEDNIYQQYVEQLIQETASDSDMAENSISEIKSKILLKAMTQIDNLNGKSTVNKLLEDIINHVLEKEVDGNMKSLTELVQKQRKVAVGIHKLKEQVIKPLKKEKYIKLVKSLIERSKSLTNKVIHRLDKIILGKQKPEEAVLTLYSMSSIMISVKKLKHIIQEIHPLLSVTEEVDLYKSLSDLVKEQEKLKAMQDNQSLTKQATEIDRATLEINPDGRDIHEHLLKLETDLISIKVPKMKTLNDVKDNEAVLQLGTKLSTAVEEYKVIVDKLDKKLAQEMKIGKMLKMKILEILLHQRLILVGAESSKLFEISTESLLNSQSNLNIALELKKLRSQSVINIRKLLVRLIIAIDEEKDHKSLVSLTSPKEQSQLKSIHTLVLKQQLVVEQLQEIPQLTSQRKSPHDILLKSVKKIKDISKEVDEILEPVLKVEKTSDLNPVVVRILGVLSKHVSIVDVTHLIVKNGVLVKATSEDPDLDNVLQMKSDLKEIKMHVVKQLDQVEKAYLAAGPSDLKDPLSVLTLLKKFVELEAKQMKLKTLAQDVLEDLDTVSSPNSPPEETIKHKKLLFDVISQATDIQHDIDSLTGRIRSKVLASPEDETIVDLPNGVQKKQKALLDIVKPVEDRVKRLTSIDPALSQPLLHLQQLKDKAQRQVLKIKDIKEELKKSVGSLSSLEALTPSIANGLHKPIRATVIVSYGPVHEEPKTMQILLIGKKSVEQLLWEKAQSLPGKQDELVRQYLQDKRDKDDRVAVGYRQIKDELNIYRHLHLLVSYEDSLPPSVRAVSWTMHELAKHFYYKKVTLVMPDETNLANKLDIKLDMKRDDKFVDVEIKTPHETTILRDLEVPAICKVAAIPRNRPVKEQLIHALTGTSRVATCEVSRDRIKTLRGNRYEVDMTVGPCEKVLALDCGLSDKLVVTSMSSPSQPDKKILKIITSFHKIEVSPLKSDMEVKVDDTKKDLKHPLILEDHVTVSKHPDGSVKILLPHVGVAVITDGEKSSIRVSKIHSPKLCGLCGDPSAGIGTDMNDPHQVPIPEPHSFLSTYLVPDTQCDAKTLQSKTDVPGIRKAAKFVKPIKRTMIMIQKKRSKTCFSQTPVNSCPPTSQPEGTQSVLVPFHCLRSTDPQVAAYKELAKKHVIEDFRYKSLSVSEYVTEPKNCLSE